MMDFIPHELWRAWGCWATAVFAIGSWAWFYIGIDESGKGAMSERAAGMYLALVLACTLGAVTTGTLTWIYW